MLVKLLDNLQNPWIYILLSISITMSLVQLGLCLEMRKLKHRKVG
jgi:hypothetical protein